MSDYAAEALRMRSEALIVIVGYPRSGWSVTARREPSGPLLVASGDTVGEACARMMDLLDAEPEPAPKIKLKRKR